ncbi:MAG TPA: tRNA uridine-5-carboxymethylaminomethyl(34) synthesis GTPase MnmE [Dissulfurispiraceae bacterium]|nr:tRNA uridine-5-carboxymethylaminomethyl(34) synthesis GTPase MnmE [Dissulfurispiraceae bacterium]
MNYPEDTIAAIATPMGEGGIGIIRLSGKDAIDIAARIFLPRGAKKLKDASSHTITYGFIADPSQGGRVDEVLVTVMRSPRTYTREDVVEINCHGGMLPLKTVLQLLLREGARIAEPGEFTRRAFLNGRIDLSQAEAVIDIIKARSGQAERLALAQLEGKLSRKITELQDRITALCAYVEAQIDFPEDELETVSKNEMSESMRVISKELLSLSAGYEAGRFFRDGVATAIVGKPNVGKSSLLNALLEKDRAIVTEMPGTTRDVIEDTLNLEGLPLRIMDTAGIRETHNLAEAEGIKRGLKAVEGADIVIAVLDSSRPVDKADEDLLRAVAYKRTIVLINKCDIRSPDFAVPDRSTNVVEASALTGEGIRELKDMIYSVCISSGVPVETEVPLITNMRHKHLLDMASQALAEAVSAQENAIPLEIVAMYVREALDCVGTIIGILTTDDILNKIFSEFCVGK